MVTKRSIRSNKIKICSHQTKTDKIVPKLEQRREVEVLPPRPRGFQPGNKTRGQVKPGEVRNPNGGVKPIAAAIRYHLDQPYDGPNKAWKSRGYNNRQVLAISTTDMALSGDIRAAEFIADRTEGKVPNPTTLSGPNGGPIDISAMTPEEKAIRIAELSARMLSAGE